MSKSVCPHQTKWSQLKQKGVYVVMHPLYSYVCVKSAWKWLKSDSVLDYTTLIVDFLQFSCPWRVPAQRTVWSSLVPLSVSVTLNLMLSSQIWYEWSKLRCVYVLTSSSNHISNHLQSKGQSTICLYSQQSSDIYTLYSCMSCCYNWHMWH